MQQKFWITSKYIVFQNPFSEKCSEKLILETKSHSVPQFWVGTRFMTFSYDNKKTILIMIVLNFSVWLSCETEQELEQENEEVN